MMLKATLLLCLVAASCWAKSGWHRDRMAVSHVKNPVTAISQLHKSKDQDGEIPQYYDTKKLVEEMEQLIQSYTVFDKKPQFKDPRRHYLALLGVVYHIIEAIVNTCNADAEMYEQDYLTLIEEYLTTALNDPKVAATKINALISDAKKKTDSIREVINDICGEENEDPDECDNSVAEVLSWKSRDHAKQAKLLLKLGELAAVFERLATEFEDVAVNHQQLNYLLDLTVKARLKPLVLKAVEVILALDIAKSCRRAPKIIPILPASNKHRKYWKHYKVFLHQNREPLMQLVPAVFKKL